MKKISSLIKRGLGLVKTGRAIRKVRTSSSEEERQRAKHYLVELLGQSRGLPTKLGQFMTMDESDSDLRETLNSAVPSMPFEEVESILDKAYGSPYSSIFKKLEKEGRPASLGQVHFGRLKDGRDVAVKVQFPHIAETVEAEMTLFGLLPKLGPVAKWGFSLEGYRSSFNDNFTKELDYQHEVQNQAKYGELTASLKNVIVPEVITKYCRPNVLVQAREEGISLGEVGKLPKPDRQSAGRAVLAHYFHMLFRHGFVHSDPNPDNFAFRDGEEMALIVYDYGSVLEISDNTRLALLRTVLAVRNRESIEPASCLAGLGFDPEKLDDLRSNLPALLNILFDPFTTEAPYNVKDWRISERFEESVGELKWWFRSAAPAELIFLMRTLHGLMVIIDRLDAQLSWQFMLDKVCEDLYSVAKTFTLPELPEYSGHAPRFDGIAKLMKVHVVKSNGNHINLSMPARVADDLEGVIDPPVLESIREQKIPLEDIQKRLRKSGFLPQEVFQVKDAARQVRVWLE